MAKYIQILSHGSSASKGSGKGPHGKTTGDPYSTRTRATPTTPSIVRSVWVLSNATAHLLSERGGGDEKDTLRIKFTVGDSFAPGTVVVMTPGEVLADAQDEEFQVGTQ